MESIVTLTGGPPWGIRIQGGRDTGIPLHVSRVNGRASQHGLQEGDVIEAVNGQRASEFAQNEIHELLKNSTDTLELALRRDNSNSANMSSARIEVNGNGEQNEEEAVTSPASTSSSSSSGSYSTTIVLNTASKPASKTLAEEDEDVYVTVELELEPETPLEEIWTPGQSPTIPKRVDQISQEKISPETEQPSSPIWQPYFSGLDRPEYRSIKLEGQNTKVSTQNEMPSSSEPNVNNSDERTKGNTSSSRQSKSTAITTTTTTTTTSTTTSSALSPTFTRVGGSSGLPPSQSPTVTLLQKAREGQISKGAVYIDHTVHLKDDDIPKDAILIDERVTYEGDKKHTDRYYALPTCMEIKSTSSTSDQPPKYDGIGPTEYGIPVGLRTGVKEEYASDWYKTMYRSLHKFDKIPKGIASHIGGYMSEPEIDRDDNLYKTKYATLEHRRQPGPTNTSQSKTLPRSSGMNSETFLPYENRAVVEIYKHQPRSISEYEPGYSSIADQEFQKFWADFWDSVGNLEEDDLDQQSLSNRPRPLQHYLPDGYDSDSTLIRKAGRASKLDPVQQKAWYKEIQKGGDIPFPGLGKAAPEKPKASPHQYQESEVNIHYRSPIRSLEKEYIEEEELQRKQENAMRKFYIEEHYKKQLQQMAEIEMRRHNDFFTPSQKSPIPLNRYDNPFEAPGMSPPKTPDIRTMARALFNFNAQTARELSLNKGDILYVNKKIDKNWYEGEHHGMIGIFPVNYIEIIPAERANLLPRKAAEGEGRVRFNFRAQTPVELSLFKGETVVLMRRVDKNWYEGRIGSKQGIFPLSYIQVMTEPGDVGLRAISPKPPASPVFSPIINGSQRTTSSTTSKNLGPTYNTGVNPCLKEEKRPVMQMLHIDTYNEPIPYRSLYSYRPQNEDELELHEGDTVYVMEKCDDGWYVGTSLRSGLFGTFPGNYVERM